MASTQQFVDYVLEQIENVGSVEAKKMFGEYTLYLNGKIFGLICDNRLLIKPTLTGREFIGEPIEAPPYPGAKMCFLIEDQLEDRDWLHELIRITLEELPEPKPKKKKKK